MQQRRRRDVLPERLGGTQRVAPSHAEADTPPRPSVAEGGDCALGVVEDRGVVERRHERHHLAELILLAGSQALDVRRVRFGYRASPET